MKNRHHGTLDRERPGHTDDDVEMTIVTLYDKISECLDKLNKAAVIDDSVFELELLVTQLRIRLHAGIYDPSKRINGESGVEVCRFIEIFEQLDQFIKEADTRTKLVQEVTSLAKTVLRKEGIPFKL
jgi:hypothetical protein